MRIAPTALALTTSLLSTSLPPSQCKKHLAIFSAATPIGTLLSYTLLSFFGADSQGRWPGIALLFSVRLHMLRPPCTCETRVLTSQLGWIFPIRGDGAPAVAHSCTCGCGRRDGLEDATIASHRCGNARAVLRRCDIGGRPRPLRSLRSAFRYIRSASVHSVLAIIDQTASRSLVLLRAERYDYYRGYHRPRRV